MNSIQLLNGCVSLKQPAFGQNPSEDAVWLQALAEGPYIKVADVGAGTGAVGLCLSVRSAVGCIHFFENDASLTPFLETNSRGSNYKVYGDVFTSAIQNEYDLVLTNPPYFFKEKGHNSSQLKKKQAHYITEECFAEWLRCCFAMLKDGGQLGIIFHFDALATVQNTFLGYEQNIIHLKTSKTKAAKRFLLWLRKCEGNVQMCKLNAFDEKVREAVLYNGESIWAYVK